VARGATAFELLPTRLGVALLPRTDRLTLRALSDRFVADAAETGLALGAPPRPRGGGRGGDVAASRPARRGGARPVGAGA
jgi:hypothetical protein